MPQSFQAVAVTLIALLPGALYVWAFERQAGRYGIGLSDRVLRFVGGSAGTWLAGAYANANGRRSYAAGYPEPQDLYLAASVPVDSETGEFLLNDEGTPDLGDGGLLIRWDEVEYLEFIDA